MRLPRLLKLAVFLSALLLLWLLSLSCVAAAADPSEAVHAVVRIPSHGGSGVVIHTEEGRSYVLTAAHLFEGRMQFRPITVNVPHPSPAAPKKVGVHLVRMVESKDVALVRVDAGPLPYVAPVAPPGHRPSRDVVSAGYDEMRDRLTVRRADLLLTVGDTTFTRQPPWHGRSGGALLDQGAGLTIGVVSGYEQPYPRGRGLHASLAAIHYLLRGSGIGPGRAPPPDPRVMPPAGPAEPAPRRGLPMGAPGGL